eukprot:TRINITY_DN1986_c0_g3_i1.p1 TRINITY_DN1986_c0_g3~~TRINITY_DN1986_c0_g3_i1.p1  ORF type:complete len:1046 (-),score=243.71 TRINITY_DN1986_c0_g3_i1:47-3184(-)
MGGRASTQVIPWRQERPVEDVPAVVKKEARLQRGDSTYSLHSEESLATKYGMLCPRTAEWFRARNENTLSVAIAFVPWIIMQSYHEGSLDKEGSVVAHRGEGAVVFSDASGFTALTERLASKPNGAELLSQCLTSFFTPLIDIISAYRGDVIKFSGDALTIYFPPFNDTVHPNYNPVMPPHGTYGLPDLGPMATAVLRASACCIEIHRRLHMFETGVDGVVLCLHIGVGCGSVAILQVGGVVPPEARTPRYEYVIAGAAIEQISVAEPLAKNGETCLSPQAWHYATDWALEGRILGDKPPECDFHILENLQTQKYTFPCVRNAAITHDAREDFRFQLSELQVILRYIPSNVYKQIENNTLTYVNEMRTVSTIFISGSGIDVSTAKGAEIAHELVNDVQHVCYAHEGSLNKYLVDDKGMLFLLVYGLPPMVHTDDPVRAVLACMDIVNVFSRLGLICRCGVTTGRAYCGVVGSAKRMEYTVLGDTVNLAARLMANAEADHILVDEATMERCVGETGQAVRREWVEIEFKTLKPILVKGKTNLIRIFEPTTATAGQAVGMIASSVSFPWPVVSFAYGGKSRLLDVASWTDKRQVESMLQGNMKSGGFIVFCGDIGFGQTELVEFVVMEQQRKHGALTVFSTHDRRPGPAFRPLQELLASILLAFRHVDSSLPVGDKDALCYLAEPSMREFVDELAEDLSFPCELWYRGLNEEQQRSCSLGTILAKALLKRLLQKHSVTCVLSLRSGSNIFKIGSREDSVVWSLAQELSELAATMQMEGAPYSFLVLLNLTQRLETLPASVTRIIPADSIVAVSPLSTSSTLDYIGIYLDLRPDTVPPPLAQYVSGITQGNALFIGEAIDSLMSSGHIKVVKNSQGRPEAVSITADLEDINIADWTTTAMVGGTMCMLESLEPLQTAVVKMATVFNGVFTIADLAASACSRYAGATFFDAFRVFYAVTVLENRGIIQRVPSEAGKEFLVDKTMECFRFTSTLVRKVGSALVLESQKKIVKRQALIDRVLARSLPGRMEELRRKKAIPHIPWYYQVEPR